MSGKKGQKGSKPTELAERFDERFMSELDGRVRVAKSLRERLNSLVSDLGGLDGLSYQELSLCKRAIHIERLIEKDELSMAHGGVVDRFATIAAINTLTSLFSKIGLKRRSKILNLKDYLNAQQPAPSGPQPSKEDA